MPAFRDPFDPNTRLAAGCGCGRHATKAEHDEALERGGEALQSRVVENTVMRALFPHDETRRSFIRAVGSSTALAAISTLFPLAAATVNP